MAAPHACDARQAPGQRRTLREVSPTSEANPNASAIELAGVAKSFGGPRPALDALDLAIPAGSYAVVVGPSGSGKTTLLKLIAGLESPDAGRVLIQGADVTGTAPHARGVALAAQGAPLYPHLNVRDNLGFAAFARGVSAREVALRVEKIASAMELSGLLSRRPGELSGGQRQRVALGRALVQQAPITLLDEPLAALEPELRTRIQGLLTGLLTPQQRERNGVFVHVTHDHDEAFALADFMVVLHEGRVLQAGVPRELLCEPASATVASFLASPPLNVLRVRLAVDGDRVAIRSSDRLLATASLASAGPGAPATWPISPGTEVIAMAVPRSATMLEQACAGGDAASFVRVTAMVERIGRDRSGEVITLRLGHDLGGGEVSTHLPFASPRVVAQRTPTPAPGQRAVLALDLAHAQFFNVGASGARITLPISDIQPAGDQPGPALIGPGRQGPAHRNQERSST
jgi:ABC-type sugar transport system ATPase subunit